MPCQGGDDAEKVINDSVGYVFTGVSPRPYGALSSCQWLVDMMNLCSLVHRPKVSASELTDHLGIMFLKRKLFEMQKVASFYGSAGSDAHRDLPQ